MAEDTTRLLVGDDWVTARTWSGGAVAAGVAAFALVAVASEPTVEFVERTVLWWAAAAALAAAVYVARNGGVAVGAFLPVPATYAVMVHALAVRGGSYDTAALLALGWGVTIGAALGVLGAVLGVAVRRSHRLF
jgi:hypothetical protein